MYSRVRNLCITFLENYRAFLTWLISARYVFLFYPSVCFANLLLPSPTSWWWFLYFINCLVKYFCKKCMLSEVPGFRPGYNIVILERCRGGNRRKEKLVHLPDARQIITRKNQIWIFKHFCCLKPSLKRVVLDFFFISSRSGVFSGQTDRQTFLFLNIENGYSS